ncbi:MAG: TraB/GumN family protein, partial [Acidiferrobacterales bacterium]
DHGLSARDLDKKKPWVVIMLLSTPRAQTGLPLDMRLQLEATLQGKPIYGLETMAEQIAVFNDMSMKDQVALLRDTLDQRQEVARQFDTLMHAYLDRDLVKLMSIVNGPRKQKSGAFVAMMDRLLTRRNEIMLARMRERLEEGNAFIAVGAAHLPGQAGLLQLLEDMGYGVSVVY